jgi:hypothetical protein
MTSEKPYWFALAESDAQSAPARKEKRNFPFLAVATLGVAVLGGSLLLNTNDEQSASAAISTISSPVTTATHVVASHTQSVSSAPAIAPVAQSKVRNSDDAGNGERENNDD